MRIEHIQDYLIYDDGRVYSFISNRFLTVAKTARGYYQVTVFGKNHYMHRLLATYFIPNPDNKPYVNHIDGNKSNNSISNLEWCTANENMTHARDTGLLNPRRGKDKPESRLTEDQIREIRSLYPQYSQGKLAKMFGVVQPQIWSIVNRKQWKHV